MFNKRIIQHFMKNAPVGLALVNSKNKVVFTNSYLHEHTGFQAKELQGEDFFDKFFPDQESKDFIRRKISTSTERPFEDFQIDIQKKSGKIMSASLSCSAFALGSKILVACVIQDMTGRNLYEKVIEAGYDNLQQVTIDLETAMKKITEQQNILKAYKARMTRELEIATSVQHAIIPTEFPTNKKIDIWGKSVSSEKLGGDYFDIFYLDKNVYGVLIADVAGHGVAASLLTTMLKAYFEYYTKQYKRPEDVFAQVNKSLSSILGDSGFFLTALYSVLDLNMMKMSSCAAGHEPAVCFQPGHKEPMQIGAHNKGLVLGAFPEAMYSSATFQLIPGCKILFYTDGITEARGESGDYFGFKKLIRYVQDYFINNRDKGVKECIMSLFSEIDSFYGKNTPNDDRTAVLLDILNDTQEG